MILHVIVAREKLVLKQFLIEFKKDWIFNYFLQNIFGFALRHPEKPANNDIANNYGLTPLALACVLGKAKVFREIIELSCQVFITISYFLFY